MPRTHEINMSIDRQPVEFGRPEDLGLRYSYALEDPENFEQKQGGFSLNVQVPATPNNDAIFNQFWNPGVIDLTGINAFTNYRSCVVNVNGIDLLTGSALLKSATHTRLPGVYTLDIYNQNSSWVIAARDLTLWDCLNPNPHTFDVTTIEKSWDDAIAGGFDSDENHDFVYAPVRYRQPFGDNDDAANIYHLRPSLSVYWLLIRGFRLLGVKVVSAFMETANYYRRLVMPWTFGDFYDINSQLTDGIGFKAAGVICDLPSTAPGGPPIYTGNPFSTGVPQSSWGGDPAGVGSAITGHMYVFDGATIPDDRFDLSNTLPPAGFDNFGLYSFDHATGTMKYTYNPPPEIFVYTGNNVSIRFTLTLYVGIMTMPSCSCDLKMEKKKNGVLLSTDSILPFGAISGGANYPSTPEGYFPVSPTVYNFVVNNINIGDVLEFRLQYQQSGSNPAATKLCSAGYIDVNPSTTGANKWQYNPVTEQWMNLDPHSSNSVWQATYSTFQMSSLQIAVGGNVNFKNYDRFRSLKFLDLLRGQVDMFDWTLQTDPITNTVYIEPTHDYLLPDGTRMDGYFKKERIDWTNKQDLTKQNTMELFSDNVRQFDFSFKGDGNDGGANIYGARYKGIYLNNKLINSVNSADGENGIISAIPGAARYVFPDRFQNGEKNQVNRFFAATMHYKHEKWWNIVELNGGSPSDNISPQLVCIIPENINDSSASAVSATFEPKLCYYAGKQALLGVGGWRWQGDPFGRGTDANGVGIPTYNSPSDQIPGQPLSASSSIGFQLPYLFAVDYTGHVASVPGQMAPILTYCNQNINGIVQPGLIKTFFLKRLARMRTGKRYKPYMRLELGDIIDWTHRNSVIINNAVYHLMEINGFDPISDDPCECVLWKVADPEVIDVLQSFPSDFSILTNPTSGLPQFDLKYARLLLYQTDIPQAG